MRLKDLVKGMIIIAGIFILPGKINAELICQSNVPDSNNVSAPLSQINSNEVINFDSLYKFDEYKRLTVKKYKIDININSDLELSGTAMIMLNNNNNHKVADFKIYSDTKIDSVYFTNAVKANWYKTDDNQDLVVKLNDTTGHLNDTVYVKYHGNYFNKNGLGWIHLKDESLWYPRIKHSEPAYYDLKFSIPERYRLAYSGKLKSENNNNGKRDYHFENMSPTYYASFVMSNFDSYEYEMEGVPKLTLLKNNFGHDEITNGRIKIKLDRDMEDEVAEDIMKSMKFFSELFGKLPYSHVYAAEIPEEHGVAFPGLIGYSWMTFVKDDEYGFNKIFRAHEVAHQWWGLGVKINKNLNNWLAEGLSEFSAMWYLQSVDEDMNLYYRHLKLIKNDLIDSYHDALRNGKLLGTISMGYANESLNIKGGYQLYAYQKPAFVFHMLRMMMLDLNTMNEDKTKKFFREYLSKYNGKYISADEFTKYLSSFFKEDMSWFMDQWVDSGIIPRIEYASKIEEQPDGAYKLKVKIKQIGFNEKFKAYVPVAILFDNDQIARVRITLKGEKSEFVFPNLPEPTEFVFNEFEGLLCIQEEVDWDEL